MFLYRCPLRWSDLDAQGHVNNAVTVDYLQEARVAFLRQGPASPLLDSGVVVVSHQVEYRRPIGYSREPVEITLGVSQLGASRIEIAYRLDHDGATAAVARTVLCAFDFDEQRPVRLKPHYREFFAAHRIDAEPLRAIGSVALHGRGTPSPLTVRWSDLDSYGHVNNAMLFDYIQQARIDVTTDWDPDMARAGTEGSGRMWLVARQDVDYLAQLPHRVEPYEARVAPVRVGTTSVTLCTEFADPGSDVLFAKAATVLVCADLTGRPADLGEATRARLNAQLAVQA